METEDVFLLIGEAAKFFKVHREVVRFHVASKPIPTKPVPYSPTGKGLDAKGIHAVADALGMPRPTLKAVRDWKAADRSRSLMRIAATAVSA
jgi:hypothetical protein